jgi:hypothetical protein
MKFKNISFLFLRRIFFIFYFFLYFSATQLCHTSNKDGSVRITAAKFGCFSDGERTDSEGVKTTTYSSMKCAAEGTSVVMESFTDDKCTKVATGDSKRTITFTDKDQTEVNVKDGKTVTKTDATQSVKSTCNGGSPGGSLTNTTGTTLNSGITTTTFSLATIAAASIAIAALL